MSDVPERLDDFTADWLSSRLEAPVDAIRVEQIGQGSGFMGQLARVDIDSPADDVPASVIVKLPTADPGARAIGEMSGVWEREHRFYAEVAPRMNIRVPRAFVNIADPPCLVLEDLAPGVVGDHVAGATLDQAHRALDTIARHHAHWFEAPDLREFDWLPGLDDPAVLGMVDVFQLGWPMFLERYGEELPDRCLRWCEAFVPTIPEWIAGHFDDPVTLTHGDFRLDNLLFYDDGSIAVIDWQLCMRGPGQTDLVYFCANNLDVPMREQYDLALIARYVHQLRDHGVDDARITVESVTSGYLEGLVFYAASFGASLLTIDPANERGTALFDSLVRRTFAALDHHSAGHVMGFGDS
jgi:hypothetical protein